MSIPRDTHRQLGVVVNCAPLQNNKNPVYLGVTLDRALTYRKHLESLQNKVNAKNGLLCCLAGSSWGAYTSTLRTGTLALVYSAAEYASPVWCRSTHTKKLDVAQNDTMRIITGCMRPTETTFLPVLAGITPPDIRREARVAKITATAKNNSDHILNNNITAADAACSQRLVSRRPFSRHAAHAVRTRSFNLTGRERFAAGRFLARVDANRTLPPSTLESGSRPEQVWTRPVLRHTT